MRAILPVLYNKTIFDFNHTHVQYSIKNAPSLKQLKCAQMLTQKSTRVCGIEGKQRASAQVAATGFLTLGGFAALRPIAHFRVGAQEGFESSALTN